MRNVRAELRRLARGYALAVGGARGARVHVLLLVAAVLLAFVHRSLLALPAFRWLDASWVRVVLAAAGLYLVGPLLRMAWGLFARPRLGALARELDDRFAWWDATETALTLTSAETQRPVGAFLLAQASGRLRDVGAERLARVQRPRPWPRRVLALLFVAVLLLPGVDGLFGRRGAGTQGDGVLGSRGPRTAAGGPRPMQADFWLQTFVQDPLPVEPLPDSEPGAPKAGG